MTTIATIDVMNDATVPFLTAEWRHLAVLNYPIDAAALEPFVPAGTELDMWEGQALVSVVGFMFLNTRVLGVAIPGHRCFEEVNLRFYVRRRAPDGWRRGVVFIKELVPRIAIALTARLVYGENYKALPMGHRIDRDEQDRNAIRHVAYWWRFRGRRDCIELNVTGPAQQTVDGSASEFITEHYWGYSRRRNGHTVEYRVEHPRWKVHPVSEAQLDCDAAALYGPQFAEAMASPPMSAFLADGSEVTVFKASELPLS